MEITPDETYLYLNVSFTQEPLIFNGPISADLMAGLLLGVYAIYSDMVENYNFNPISEYTVYIGFDEHIHETFKFDEIPDNLHQYIDYISQPNERLDEMDFFGTYPSFTWWIANPIGHSYFLVNFYEPEFIQGFITICNAFKVDFRKYTYGLPFKIKNDEKEYYAIQGYET